MTVDLFTKPGTDKIYNRFFRNTKKLYYTSNKKLINDLYEKNKEFLDPDFPEKLKSNFLSVFVELEYAAWLRGHNNVTLSKRRSAGAYFRISLPNEKVEIHIECILFRLVKIKNYLLREKVERLMKQ